MSFNRVDLRIRLNLLILFKWCHILIPFYIILFMYQ